MMTLEDLEKELNINYPTIYKQLYNDNMLNWGELDSNWLENIFPTLKSNPPLLLFGNDIEIWEPILYKKGIAEIKNHEVYDIDPKFQFVPFAKDGAGNLYCFQFDMEKKGDIPISFLPHDDGEAIILAKNFQDFIFRQLLEVVTEINEYWIFNGNSEDEIKQNLNNQLQTHRRYLTPKQIDVLEKIYQRNIFEYTYKAPNGRVDENEGLATIDEVEQIIKMEISFDDLNKKFLYISD